MESALTTNPPKIVLPDVSLAAIVRDEIMNPAGGIADFVHSAVPFVEEAVIVDTGSKDGTRQALEELQAQYPQLRVFDRQFDDYASCRNFSLDQVRTRYAFVLDADERLQAEDFAKLAEMIPETKSKGYKFLFMNRCLSSEEDFSILGHNPRIFLKGKMFFRNLWSSKYGEYLHFRTGVMTQRVTECPKLIHLTETGIVINHFITNISDSAKKYVKWYQKVERGLAAHTAPSEIPESQLWKAYNPRREEFR